MSRDLGFSTTKVRGIAGEERKRTVRPSIRKRCRAAALCLLLEISMPAEKLKLLQLISIHTESRITPGSRMLVSAFATDLLQNVSDSILVARSDDTICFANSALCTLIGTTECLIGQSARSIIKGWEHKTSAPTSSKASLIRADGVLSPVELTKSYWHHDGDDFTGAIIRSIAGHQAAITRLEEHRDQIEAAFAEPHMSHQRLHHVVEMLPQAVCVFDAEDRYVIWNARYAELYPEIAGHLRVGARFDDILRVSIASGQFPEIMDDAETWISQRLAKHARQSWREEQQMRDGRWLLHDDRRLADGGAIGMRIDITEIKQREASFRLLFQGNPLPMLLFEPETLSIIDANDAATSFYGLTRAGFRSLSVPDLHLETEREKAAQTFGALADAYEERTIWHHRIAPGQTVNVLIFIRMSRHLNQPCLIGAVVDVSDRIQAEAQIAHTAHHDPLTGLANRVRFRQVAEAALSTAIGRDLGLALHCIDLDGFKPINDTYGHSIGDRLLQMVGERLHAAVRGGDLVARLGGDEFAVVQISGIDDAEKVAERLVSCMRESFHIEGLELNVGASVGLAIAPMDGDTLDKLMLVADGALYAAKSAGRGVWRQTRRN